MRHALLVLLPLSILLGSGALFAADADTPTTRQIIDTLKMRGVTIVPPQQRPPKNGEVKTPHEALGDDTAKPTPVKTEAPTINVRVLFEFASSRLASDAKALLDNIGAAFVSKELAPYKFSIAGHTDALGSDTYNLALSTRRAEAVKAYLVARFAIAPDRLISVGYGERRLLLADDPTNAANRRVQITNLGAPAAPRD